MPDAGTPMFNTAPVQGEAKSLTDSREITKQLIEELRQAERELARIEQGIRNKTLGGAGGWQQSFDALHQAQNRLESHKAEQAKKEPASNPTALGRLAEMYKGRTDPLNMARTGFQALTGQWTPAGEAVAAGYNILQIAASEGGALVSGVGMVATAAHTILSNQFENRQAFGEAQSQRASAFNALAAEDRVSGRFGAPLLLNIFRKQEEGFQREYAYQVESGGYLGRAKTALFGGNSAAIQAAQDVAKKDAQRLQELGIYGKQYAEMTDLENIEATSTDVLDNRARRARYGQGFWHAAAWWAEAAFTIGADPMARDRHEQALKMRDERRSVFAEARQIETYLKTQDGEKGITYRAMQKDRNVRQFAVEERLYKSTLQWNSF